MEFTHIPALDQHGVVARFGSWRFGLCSSSGWRRLGLIAWTAVSSFTKPEKWSGFGFATQTRSDPDGPCKSQIGTKVAGTLEPAPFLGRTNNLDPIALRTPHSDLARPGRACGPRWGQGPRGRQRRQRRGSAGRVGAGSKGGRGENEMEVAPPRIKKLVVLLPLN